MKRLIGFLLSVTAGGHLALAQLDRGSITGSVTDPTGAVVPAVTITIRNMATGAVYPTATTASGQYTMANLPIGTYALAFEAPGFKRAVRSGVELSAAEVRRVDVTLEVGDVAESVEVSAELPRLQTDAPNVATSLGSRTMVDLPLAIGEGGRHMQDLALKIVPNLQGQGGWNLRAVGSPTYTLDSQLDGASVQAYSAGRFDEASVSLESIQEFKVQTSAISAEFGRTSGAILSYVMKSGANEIHGSAYGMLRNEALNANTFANNYRGARKALDRKWNYAFGFGGPIKRDKSFFYTTYERYHENNLFLGAPDRSYPLAEFYEGDLSWLLGPATAFTDALGNAVPRGGIYDPATFYQLPSGRWYGELFPNNRIPRSRFSTVSQNLNAIATRYYLPTVKDASGTVPLQRNAIGPAQNIILRDQWQFSLKMDHNISDRHKLSGSFALNKRPRTQVGDSTFMYTPQVENGGPLSGGVRQQILSPLARLSHNWIVSPTKLNHFLIYFNRFGLTQKNFNYGLDGARELGIRGVSTTGYPSFYWGTGPFVTFSSPGHSVAADLAGNSYGLMDTFSVATGRHFLKFGFDVRRNRLNERANWDTAGFYFDPLATSIPREPFSGTQTGHSFASYLLGIVHRGVVPVFLGTGSFVDYASGFVQDEYKLTDKLSLNLGVRWDYVSPMYEQHGRISAWTPKKIDPISGLPGAYAFGGDCPQCTGKRHFGESDLNNFAPRIGFAYRLFPRTTLRGSYAVFYHNVGSAAQSGGNAVRTAWTSSWALDANAVDPWRGIFHLDSGVPADRFRPATFNESWGNSSTPAMFDPQYGQTAYTQRWNFNIQHEIAPNTVLDVGYLAAKGNQLVGDSLSRPNQLPPGALKDFGRALLNPVRSAQDAAQNGIPYPYPGFQGSVASALRQYPQVVGNALISVIGAPLGFSTTHSLQITVDKRFSQGLTAYVNYVWSKTLANVDSGTSGGRTPLDYYNLSLEKSFTQYDIPHAFKAYVAYELPVGRGKPFWSDANKFTNAVFGGWSIAAVLNYFSGAPLIFSGASSPLSGAWNGGQRINAAPGEMKASGFDKSRFELSTAGSPNNTYLNKSVYSDAAPLTLGNAAYAYSRARGFGTINEDFSLLKNYRIHEKYRVQLRGDFLNVFNRHTLGGIVTSATNPLFGQVTSVSGNRQLQLGLRLDF